MWVCVGYGGMLSCSYWHKIVFLFPLHIACNFESYAAHRTPPISDVCCCLLPKAAAAEAAEDTSRAAVQCTSSLLIPCAQGKLNVKHHRTTPNHRRENRRSCAGDKREHQNEYKRRSSSIAGMHVYKRGWFQQTRDIWRKRASMGYRVGRVSPRAASRCCGGRTAVDFVVCFGLGGF